VTRALLAMIALAAGCLRGADGYHCATASDCELDGVAGRCEAVGYCSFPDATCPGGSRFGGFSGPDSNQCTTVMDAGVDANDTPPQFVNFAKMDNASDGTSEQTVTIPVVIPSGYTNLFLIVALAVAGDGPIETITYDNRTLTPVRTITGDQLDSYAHSDQWQLVAPLVGTYDVVIKIAAGSHSIHAVAMVFAGVNQTNPVFATAADSSLISGVAATSSVLVDSAANQLVESTTAQANRVDHVGPGETELYVDNLGMMTSLDNSGASIAPASAPSTTMVWTYGGSDDYQTIAVALQP